MKNYLFMLCFFLFACKASENKITQEPNIQTNSNIVHEVQNLQQNIVSVATDSPKTAEIPVWIAKKDIYKPESDKKFKLFHTKLEVSFDWKKQYLYGTATLSINPYFYPQTEAIFDAKGFEILSVEMILDKNIRKLNYEYDSLKLKVFLEKPYNKNELINLKIRYIAKPNERKIGGSTAITSDKGLYFINPTNDEANKPQQIWTQGQTESSSCWFPTFDSPNIKTSQEIYITVDSDFQTLSNGKLISSKNNANGTRTDHWKQEKPHAPYLFMMAIGRYAVVKDKWKNLEVNYYVEPKFEKYAKNIFGNTPEMMTFFSDLLDFPFPWDKYSQVVVRDYVSGAMENTSASVFMENLQVDKRYLIDDHWDKIIAHELFHQWFGDLVTAESWANLPLNESFANYAEYLWVEYKYGESDAQELLRNEWYEYLDESTTKQEPMIRYHYKEKEDMFDRHSYSKGCLILNMLRKYVGDEAFFTALQKYLKKYQYKNAEIHDLRLVFEEVIGQDLNWFFDQWFLSAGHPKIAIEDSYENGEIILKIKQLQDTRYTPIYVLPLQISWVIGGKKINENIRITQKEEEFRFKVSQKPETFYFDAQKQLLGEIILENKGVEDNLAKFKYASNFLQKFDALENLKKDFDNEKVKALFIKTLDDKFAQIRNLSIQVFNEYAGQDQSQIAEKLKIMSKTDKNSTVRSTALNVLASFGNKYTNFFIETMPDSSYIVLMSSLYGYHNSGGADKILDFLPTYENLDYLPLVVTLADFYGYYKMPNKTDWFIQKINNQNGQPQVYVINYLGNYLLNQGADAKQKGCDFLEKMALSSKNFQLRIACFQAMTLQIEDLPKLKESLEKIRNKETDERALQAFKLFLGE